MRLDEALVAAGLAASRARARDMILRGTVSVDGKIAGKPAQKVDAASRLEAADPASRYVSRAALKLVAGLDHFGLDPSGRVALDLGASTGGFTQVLLERGAARVVAVDVGHGQMDAALRADPRVTCLEGLNARDLDKGAIGGAPISAIVSDVSFISLRLALPPALALAAPGSFGLFLVKPQFEIGRGRIGKGGIVRNPADAEAAAEAIARFLADEQGWTVEGFLPSPIAGGDGNREYLMAARNG